MDMHQVRFMVMPFPVNLLGWVPGSSLNGPIIGRLFRFFFSSSSFIPMDGMQNGRNDMQITAQWSTDPEWEQGWGCFVCVCTWSRGIDDLVISSLSDLDPPSLSSMTRSMGIFPFKQLMYRWQKLSHSSWTCVERRRRHKNTHCYPLKNTVMHMQYVYTNRATITL